MNGTLPLFPTYTQIPSRVPLRAWRVLRLASIVVALAMVTTLVLAPDVGLLIFWFLLVPTLPLLFLVAPGLWRNLCPLAASNQLPRVFGFTRALEPPRWLRDNGVLIGGALFLAIVPTRKVLFNYNGPAVAALLLVALAAAFSSGVLLKGKSGWCSSICPLLPVQRLYGQTPLKLVRNTHCEPCVGCARNCYDFNPRVAYLADQYEDDRQFTLRRRLFAGVFPGLVLAYFLVPDPPEVGVARMYGLFALVLLLSAGLFFSLDALVPARRAQLTAVFAGAAFALFYWFTAAAVGQRLGLTAAWPVWAVRVAAVGLVAFWLVRTFRTERAFVAQVAASPVRIEAPAPLARVRQKASAHPEVTFQPDGDRIVAQSNATLLEVAERAGQALEAGCRMGMCGSDPVAVTAGTENLSPVEDEERNTLARLGLAESTRMACSARVLGDCTISLAPERAAAAPVPARPAAPDVTSVVVIGNGIAGVTAVDHIRRNHPTCELHLVGRETHHLYNRMAISRLVYGRSAMEGLYLMPESWWAEQRVTCWLNTIATALDLSARTVTLGTGESLPYSRLVLAMGSASFVPPIPGLDKPGAFVLREAEDAMQLRAYAQSRGAQTALVAGGGLLGLEAAYALSKLGLRVTVVEVAPWLMMRQLDARGAELLRSYLQGLGIRAVTGVGVEEVLATDRVARARLADDQEVPCDVFLTCAGIRPNVGLAVAAGLEVGRGVLVDDRMRTSDQYTYAAGDVAEHRGAVYGLWPPSVEQGEVAGTNAAGGSATYAGTTPVTMLKVVGADLLSVGRIQPDEGEEVIVVEQTGEHRYAKLIIGTDGVLTGAVLLGHPREAPAVTSALKRRTPLEDMLPRLRDGDLSVLQPEAAVHA